jgi:hypothetical protein
MKTRFPSLPLAAICLISLLCPPLEADQHLLPFPYTGDLYVLDDGCQCVLQISPEGDVSIAVTRADILEVTNKNLVQLEAEGLIIDAEGTMFFSESEVDGIVRRTKDGSMGLLVAESEILAAIGGNASEVDIDQMTFGIDNQIYAVDDENESVLRFDPQTGEVSVFVSETALQDALGVGQTVDLSTGIAASNYGFLYGFSDGTPNAVFAICPNGAVKVLHAGPPLEDPDEFATRAPNGDILIVDDGGDETPQTIQRFTQAGDFSTFLTEIQLEAVTKMDLNPEAGLAFDSEGNFFMGETGSQSILKFDKDLNGIIWVSRDDIEKVTMVVPSLTGQIAFAPEYRLFFAQFADGAGLFSQFILVSLSKDTDTYAEISLRTPEGEPLSVDLDGQQVDGKLEDLVIPADGTAILSTDGKGAVVVGSATVTSDLPLAGVIVFGGGSGLAGVPSSAAHAAGFTAPILEEGKPLHTRTGFAVMNLEGEELTLELALLDEDGDVLAQAQILLPALGQLARFADEIAWDSPVDFSDFRGTVQVSAVGRTGATVIQTRPQQFATMPVATKN